jgi:lysyl endopeptidase
MINSRTLSVLLLILLQWVAAQSQPHTPLPLSFKEKLPSVANYVKMGSIDVITLQESSDSTHQSYTEKAVFAFKHSVNFNPINSGEWHHTNNGSIWRLGIVCKGAYSIYATFELNSISPSSAIFMYSPNYEDFKGPFMATKLNWKTISLPAIKGDTLIIELNTPNIEPSIDEFTITKIFHDFANGLGNNNRSLLKNNNLCFEDINGSNGKYWQTEKRAVCKIVSDGQLSTGTLVGNTSGNTTPYILTANHTLFDASHAQEALFYFNDDTDLESAINSNNEQCVSGGELVATSVKRLDFSLIRLNTPPPAHYRAYYAGWDSRLQQPLGSVCIHHLGGQAKQIAVDVNKSTIADYKAGYDARSFLHVGNWEAGTTSFGSSGAPLFNKEHRLVGSLTGGKATCTNPSDDYFSMFAMAWDKYPQPNEQLKYWLDSANTNIRVIDGYDPYGFSESNCDTTWNSGRNQDLQSDEFYGNLYSNTQRNVSTYAEKFNLEGKLQLPSVLFNIRKAKASNPLSYVIVKVWEGDNYPLKEVHAQHVFLKHLNEQTLETIEFDSIVTVSGNFFVGYETSSLTSLDVLELNVFGQGITTITSMHLFSDSWQKATLSVKGSPPLSMGIGIVECYGRTMPPSLERITIFPNPCFNAIDVKMPNQTVVNQIVCHSLMGIAQHISTKLMGNTIHISFSLAPGIYQLTIDTVDGRYVEKFIVKPH